MQRLDPRTFYRQYLLSLPIGERIRNHRIDPSLGISPVQLDDVGSIKRLKVLVKDAIDSDRMSCNDKEDPADYLEELYDRNTWNQVRNLKLSMVASSFYAILSSISEYDSSNGSYLAKLFIVSRWEEDRSIQENLFKYLQESHFYVQNARFPCRTPLEIVIAVPSIDQSIDIQLEYKPINDPAQYRSHMRRSISGFPTSISQMRYLQGPIYFGTDTATRKTKRPPSGEAQPQPKRRRQLHNRTPSYYSKVQTSSLGRSLMSHLYSRAVRQAVKPTHFI